MRIEETDGNLLRPPYGKTLTVTTSDTRSAAGPTAAVSDKPWDRGHRAHYLGAGDCRFPYGADELVRLAQSAALSLADQGCFDEIVAALRAKGALPFAWTPQEQFFIAHNATDRVVPYLIYRFKFRVLAERHQVSDFPLHILIEPMSVCNLRCVMCFQVDKSFTRKPYMGAMNMELFRNVIDQAAEGGAGAISIGSRGEPFLHPKLPEMLRYASDKKTFFDLKINTNATRLTEAQCHALLSSDVNLVVLSIDAHEKELYEKIRVRGDFDQVLANVRRLRAIRDRDYPDSKIEIRVSGVKFRPDQDEKAFMAFWSDICDTVVYVRAQKRWNTYENPIDPDVAHPCSFLWNRLYVWHDGKCNPCDEDYKSLLSPGSAHERSLKAIWQGETMTKMREAHLTGRRGCFNPCDRCGV